MTARSKPYIKFKGAVLLLLFFMSAFSLNAQNRAVTDTLTRAYLPAVGYNSDIGLILGGLMNSYHYKDGIKPFYNYTSLAAIGSTRGLFSFQIFIDKPKVFDSNNRLSSESVIARFLQDQYYGIGNYSELNGNTDTNPDYYFFNSFYVQQEFIFRTPVQKHEGIGKLEWLTMATAGYYSPFDNGGMRLFTQQKPHGYKGGRTVSLGTGIILDSRDSEFKPTKGRYLSFTGQFAHQFIGSSYNYFLAELDLRNFYSFHLVKDITLANRLFFSKATKLTPFWKLPELGGEESLRGYAENRFVDKNAVLFNTELRTWLFRIPSINARFGGTLFMDIGRTFPDGSEFSDIFEDLKYTFGFGGNSSFFSDDFIFRGDIGFSKEDMGVYLTAGYMF